MMSLLLHVEELVFPANIIISCLNDKDAVKI